MLIWAIKSFDSLFALNWHFKSPVHAQNCSIKSEVWIVKCKTRWIHFMLQTDTAESFHIIGPSCVFVGSEDLDMWIPECFHLQLKMKWFHVDPDTSKGRVFWRGPHPTIDCVLNSSFIERKEVIWFILEMIYFRLPFLAYFYIHLAKSTLFIQL